jgi:predicted metal-dependent HD superfamily phosphohydrolase
VLFESFSAFSATDTQAVRDLILATATHLTAQPSIQYYDGFGRDMDFFLDLDLSSLGASWPVFRDNLDRIRVEFSFVPEQEFYHDRLRMFDKFLSYGDRLFRLDASRALWLAQARSNIARASQELIDSLKN